MDDPGGQRLGLAPITLAEQPYFAKILSSLKQPISDYSFANTYAWSTSLKLYWTRLSRHLCVFANGTGDLTMLKPPLPEPGATEGDLADCLRQCFDIMDEYNCVHANSSHSRIEYCSDEMLERLRALDAPGFNLSATPMAGDYIYDMARMIDLAGGSLKSKRHSRSRFMREYPDHRTEPFADAHVPACFELLELWQRRGDAAHEGEVNESHIGSDILRMFDAKACELALEAWKELGLTGMSLFVRDKLIGFTFGEAISPLQASILIEKTHPEYHGAAQFIFAEFCRQHWSQYPECNVGDDWGIPSLRFTKQSYRPIRMLSKYILTRQPVVVQAAPNIDVPMENPKHTLAPSNAAPRSRSWPSPLAASRAELLSPPVDLRRATLHDVPSILDLERACFNTLEETFNRRQVRYLIGDPRAIVTVAVQDDRVLGWAVGLVRQHRKTRSGRLYAVAVHPEAQGRRLGRSLVERTLTSLAELGIVRIYLEVRADNAPAIDLYRKLGFIDHRDLPNYYSMGNHGRRMKLALAATMSTTPQRRDDRHQLRWDWAEPSAAAPARWS